MRGSDKHEIESGAGPLLSSVLARVYRHPKRFLIVSWNWKAAALSVLFRTPIFLITTHRHGLQTMATAGIVESVFRIAITGVYASITQAVEWAEPQWAVAVVVLAVIPGGTVALEAFVHSLASTPNLRAGLAISLILSVLSSGFNWFSMRKGALLVGQRASSFGTDLARMPVLIGHFVAGPVLMIWPGVRGILSRGKAKLPEMFDEKAPFQAGNRILTDPAVREVGDVALNE